jgi:hypothetical protein
MDLDPCNKPDPAEELSRAPQIVETAELPGSGTDRSPGELPDRIALFVPSHQAAGIARSGPRIEH